MTDSLCSSSSPSGTMMRNLKSECGCCCFDFLLENMVRCPKGHRFCFGCLRRQVEEIIYGNFKATASLPCIDTHGCTESIPSSEIRRALAEDVIQRYQACQAQEAVLQAKLENLVYCPFCSIPCDVDKCVETFECPNPKCLQDSCIQCKKPSHVPLRCEEIEKTSETGPRTVVEERMTKAVVRECKTCKAQIVKQDGCNRLTCTRCRTTMCYVCRDIIWSGYEHFCDHDYSRRPGKPCQICKNSCSLWETEIEDNVALDAREEALKEFGDNHNNLLDQKIGPPLVKKTVQPSNRRMQARIVDVQIHRDLQAANPVELGWHRDEAQEQEGDPYFHNIIQQLVDEQLANMVLPPPPEHEGELRREQYMQRLRQLLGDQLANMVIPIEQMLPQMIVRPDDGQVIEVHMRPPLVEPPDEDEWLAVNMQFQANGNDGDGAQENNAQGHQSNWLFFPLNLQICIMIFIIYAWIASSMYNLLKFAMWFSLLQFFNSILFD